MSAKQRAAEAAIRHVKSGMTVGLGTGSTAKLFIAALGAEMAAGRITDIRGVATSVRSDEQARALGITVIDLADAGHCDVTVDGADEVDPHLNLIKGLGGALLREKIIAENTKKMVVVVDDSKIVPHLGAKSPVPVEVVEFSHEISRRYLESLGCTVTMRMDDHGNPYITDNGNRIYDCRFDRIIDPIALDHAIKAKAGIVETGLFVGIASVIVVAGESGVREMVRDQ
ncbi:MAG: ribose-5-phosphate isomerase RpiA [Burkholderiales bacterium]|nr:ribose-5-phosphate isomerase RpiA [Phycisphaerae bacterium]